MADRDGIFAGDNPFTIAQQWLEEAEKHEINDANAMALATVDAQGLPDVRVVLLKEIAPDGFVFFTNYQSRKGQEIEATGKAAFNIHWKSLRRQIRVRGDIAKVSAQVSDAYFATRDPGSRVGAWASRQSQPLASRQDLIDAVEKARAEHGKLPQRPPHWGGYKITPSEIEFWADGEFRLHDRFRWERGKSGENWHIQRLNP